MGHEYTVPDYSETSFIHFLNFDVPLDMLACQRQKRAVEMSVIMLPLHVLDHSTVESLFHLKWQLALWNKGTVMVCSMFLDHVALQRESEISTVGGLASSCFVLVLTGFSSRETGLLSWAQLASWLTLIWRCLSVTALYRETASNLDHNCLP